MDCRNFFQGERRTEGGGRTARQTCKLVRSEVISNSFCDFGLTPGRYGVVLVRGETLILSKTAPFW
jgi:hypothetical protein